MKTTVPFIFGCALVILIGCGQVDETFDLSYPNHSVIVISIDTCRADYVEPFGTKASTPNLKALAEDGVWFSNAVTTAPLTVPAHASLFTGLYPVETGMRDNFQTVLSPDAITTAEYFQQAGYTTSGIIGAVLLSESWGFQQGFDYFDDEFTSDEYTAQNHTVERNGSVVSAKAIEWLNGYAKQDEKKSFYLFLHYYDPHQPYVPPEPYQATYSDTPYAGEIAYTDECIGRVISDLKTKGLYDDSIIVVVGDHGESLGEHGETSHGIFLYEEAVHIPLIVKLPAGTETVGVESKQPVCITDVMPTLLDVTDAAVLDEVVYSGISLAPWLSGDEEIIDGGLLLETQYPTVYNWSPLFALRTSQWKYIQAPKPELYNLVDDPDEANNLVEKDPVRAAELKEKLEDTLLTAATAMSMQAGGGVSSSRNEQLSSLGYVGGSSSGGSGDEEEGGTLPDPKDMIDVHLQFEQGVAFLSKQQYDRAEELFQSVASADPKNPSAYHHLAEVYGKRKEWNKAQEAEQKALDISPENITYQLQMAWILIQQKEYESSRDLLLRVISHNPNIAEAQFLLGVNALEQGKINESMGYLLRTQMIAPNYPELAEIMQKVKSAMK